MIRGVEGYSDMFSKLPDSKMATRSMSSNFGPMVDFRVGQSPLSNSGLKFPSGTKFPRSTGG